MGAGVSTKQPDTAKRKGPLAKHHASRPKKQPAKEDVSKSTIKESREGGGDAANANNLKHIARHFRNSDDSEALDLAGLKEVLGDEINISDEALTKLFNELDADGDGRVRRDEFLSGLRQRPAASGLQAATSLFHSSGVVEVLARHYNSLLQRRLGLAEDVEVTLPMLLEHARPDDLQEAIESAKDDIVMRGAQQLEMLKENRDSASKARAFKDKFAFEAGTFEGTYKGMPEFLEGVEGALGLPGHDIYAGIAMEFCNSEDSKDEFQTTNYGGTTTTPEQEYNFVVNPTAARKGSAKRTAVPLHIFLYAACAQKQNSDDKYNTPLEDLDGDTRNGVKSVLLRRVLEAGLWKAVVAAAAEQDDALARLAGLTSEQLRQLKAALTGAMRRAKVASGTGQPQYEEVVAAMVKRKEALVTEEELEALVRYMRRTLAGACLAEEEIIALRLYTGPAYMKLNGTLREVDNGRKGNRYESTVFATISGMVKLASVSPIPSSRVVYRGQHGMRLPKCFWLPNSQGVKGGVEMAFLSTTTDMQVAVDYAGAGGSGVLPTVFAIRVGAVDKGAALGFLSQYPEEEEILMPPRSFLEVVDEPSLLPTPNGPVLSIPVALNCNLLSPTLEKIRDGRKAMLVATLEHTRKEIKRDLEALLKSTELQQRAARDIFFEDRDSDGVKYKHKLFQSMKDEGTAALLTYKQRSSAWFRSDGNFKWAMKEALELKRISLGKVKLWMEARNLYVPYLSKISALDCDRKAVGRLVRLLEEAKQKAAADADAAGSKHAQRRAVGGGWTGRVRDLALELCRHRELISDDVEERLGGAANASSGGETALMREAAAGNAQAVALLLEAAADPNATRADGRTALMLASQCGQTETARVLGKGDADADWLDVDGRSCIFYAAGNGHTDTARALVCECGADPNLRSHSQWTAVIAAAYDGFKDTVTMLVTEGGVDVNAVDGNGWTAAFYAAQNGHTAVLAWLVREGGAEVDARDKRRRTAAMIAAQNGHVGVLKWLVAEGSADIDAEADKGWTAVKAARKARQQRALEWLLTEAGAKDDADVHGELETTDADDDMMALKVA